MGVMVFLFVPETFWSRSPLPKPKDHARPNFMRRLSSRYGDGQHAPVPPPAAMLAPTAERGPFDGPTFTFETSKREGGLDRASGDGGELGPGAHRVGFVLADKEDAGAEDSDERGSRDPARTSASSGGAANAQEKNVEQDDALHKAPSTNVTAGASSQRAGPSDTEKAVPEGPDDPDDDYTMTLRQQPARTFVQQLRPYHGRLNSDRWFKVMLRPFVLFSYPAILWSSAVYSCSVGWLIVISEALAMIYQESARGGYNFTPLQTGLVYISPFVGGLFGTAVAGKVSDVVVKAMSRRNGGLYEPEFRLVMGIPILITTTIGLMGFGWSAQERDHWIVPTIFFGIISFGCSLGSTTSITFCVDSYRQYAGEALVTLNFSKNIFHGLVFSLFFTHWMAEDGAKTVFIWTGVIQLIVLLTTIPLYIYGKRLRMWTVRKNYVEKLIKP
ncbi:hypothetical protein IMZ48_11395 [Candidatus Bathyarchaeota archaeon]|nr:hypothetical protein [Candidatus Bathyarchaeota archaeon]